MTDADRTAGGGRLGVAVLVIAVVALLAAAGCSGTRRPDEPGPTSNSAAPGPIHLQPGHNTIHLTSGGVARTARIFVPASMPTGKVPLLVAMHGGGGSAAHFEASAGFDDLATNDGFIAAYPQAVAPAGRTSTWNAGECCGYAARTGVADVRFIEDLVAELSAAEPIDPARVFATGESNGGMMAYRLACDAAAVFAGIGVQSATLAAPDCHPSRPVSLLHIHGTADDHVPLAGGHGSATRADVDYTPPLSAATSIAAADACGPTPSPGPDERDPDASVYMWRDCPPGIAVQFVAVTGMGHSWQSSSAAHIWQFLSAHPRPGG